MLMIFWTIAIMMRSEEVPKKAVSSSHCSLDDVWIGPKEKMTWAVMPDEKKGFTFNLLRSCWGFAAPQIEAITDQRPASGWHISWGAAGSNHQNQRFSHSQHSGGLSVYPKATGMVTALNQDVITRHWNPKKSMDVSHPLKEKESIETLGFFSLQLDPAIRVRTWVLRSAAKSAAPAIALRPGVSLISEVMFRPQGFLLP